jgi:hypothetical protein
MMDILSISVIDKNWFSKVERGSATSVFRDREMIHDAGFKIQE